MTEQVNACGQPLGPEVTAWSERARPGPTPVAGRYCRLEPVSVEQHAQALFESYMRAPDGRDWTYLFAERPESASKFRQYLTRLAASSDPLHYAIVDLATGRPVGTAALMRIDPAHGVIEIGYLVFSPLLKKTRAATEAMYLLMRRVFDELHYRRCEWKCDSLNAASRAAALRYGFAFEGVFRNASVYKGRSRDTAWFAIIDTQWPKIRAAFEHWLDPQNFDSAGMQRRPLALIREPL